MAQRETENYAYAKFWGDKQRALVCYGIFWSGQFPDQRVRSLVADLQSSVCFVLVYFFS